MTTAAAYLRVSTQEQTELSPDSQLKALDQYAKAHGMEIPSQHIYRDDGISGRSAQKRPGFQQMIAAAKQSPSPFSVILVWKFSRFARNQEESIVYKSLLRRECGVEVVSVSEPLDGGPFGELIERIIEWMDAFYSVRLAGEVRRGMAEKASRGGVVSVPPLGYDIQDGGLVPSRQYAPMVQEIFHRFVHGGMSCREIGAFLNSCGFRTRSGNPFEPRVIQYILKNPAYLGKIRWNPHKSRDYYGNGPQAIVAEGSHPPLVSQELFCQAQLLLKQQAQRHIPNRREVSSHSFLLSGLVRCSSCGAPMVRTGKDALQCSQYQKGRCAVSHWTNLPRLCQCVTQALCEAVPGLSLPAPPDRAGERLPMLEREQSRRKLSLSRAREAYLSGTDSLEEYRKSKQSLEGQLKEIQSRIHALSAQEPEGALTLCRLLQDTGRTEAEKNAVLRQVVHHITWSGEQMEIVLFPEQDQTI